MTGTVQPAAEPGPAPIRLLHVSDLHLEEPQDAGHVRQLAAVAAEQRVSVLLIVGDFFDHGRVSAATLHAAGSALREVPAPVVILPGNHDPYLPGSLYDRADLGDNVHVLSKPEGETYEIADLDLAIWGRPHCGYHDFRPMAGVPPRGPATWQIALAHGHLTRGQADLQRAYPIAAEEIAASDRDYVALGHWDMPFQDSFGSVFAAYSGSPSRTGVCALATLALTDGGREMEYRSVALR